MASILVVDDSAEVVRMLTAALGSAGHTVRTAFDFEGGRRALMEAPPDLLIVDVRLGGFNGLQLAIHASLHQPNTAVIVMTGYPDPVLQAEAHKIGAAFILKPFEREDFLARVVSQSLGEKRSS
jgi:two-component system sensor histidine kinase/response regulator